MSAVNSVDEPLRRKQVRRFVRKPAAEPERVGAPS
jgi:hypothetical protein